MNIPFVDLQAQYQRYKDELDYAVASVIQQNAFVRGPFVAAFEKEYAEKYGVEHCVSCANGTDALYIALRMMGIGPGDEVITTASSWISTSEVISQAGAKVVFVDIDPKTYLINTDKIEEKISSKTKAIIPVHLYGQCLEMPAVMKLAEKYNLKVIEDCAQAHFAEYDGRKAGTFGDVGTFSFYPGKNLGAWGDAGCIVTNNSELAEKCRMFANHGSLTKHQHRIEGVNSRLDGLQAAVLSVKLKYIMTWTQERQSIAQKYNAFFSQLPELITPYVKDKATHVYHVYCLRAQNRDNLEMHLKENGVPTARHYPTPLPFLEAYKEIGHKTADFPEASGAQKEIISLPIFPEMTEGQIDYVTSAVGSFYNA